MTEAIEAPQAAASTVVVQETCAERGQHDWQYSDEIKGDVCSVCGQVSTNASSQSLELLGPVIDDGEWIGGRQYLHDNGANLGQLRATLRGQHVKGTVIDYKADHARRRKSAYVTFIRQVCLSLEMPGIIESSKVFFLKAKTALDLNWGRKSKHAALVAVYINARITDRKVSLTELASLGQVDIHHVLKMFQMIQKKFDLPAAAKDPALHADRVLEYCQELSKQKRPAVHGMKNTPFFSQVTIDYLRALDWTRVRKKAEALLYFVDHTKLVANRTPEPVACSVVQLAMESASRKAFPLAMELQFELAYFCGVGQFTIAERTRELIKALRELGGKVPFLTSSQIGTKRELAPYVDDIVAFHNAEATKNKPLLGLDQTTRDLVDLEQTDSAAAAGGPAKEASQSPAPQPSSSSSSSPATSTSVAHPAGFGIASASPSVLVASVTRKQEGGPRKRPAQFMRATPQLVKRARTIEKAAKDLLSSAVPSTSRPSPLGSSVVTAAPLTEAEAEATAPPFRKPPARGRRKKVAPSGLDAHNPNAVKFRRMLLAGVDPAAIFSGRAERRMRREASSFTSSGLDGNGTEGADEGGSSSNVSRPDRAVYPGAPSTCARFNELLWHKTADEIDDDELFEDGELDAYFHTQDELETLKQLPKYKELLADREQGDRSSTSLMIANTTKASTKTTTSRKGQQSKDNSSTKQATLVSEADAEAEAEAEAERAIVDVFVNGRRTKLTKTANETLQRILAEDDDDDIYDFGASQRNEGGGGGRVTRSRAARQAAGETDGRSSPVKRARRWSTSADEYSIASGNESDS